MAEVAIPRRVFADILQIIAGLGPPPWRHEAHKEHPLLELTTEEVRPDECEAGSLSAEAGASTFVFAQTRHAKPRAMPSGLGNGDRARPNVAIWGMSVENRLLKC